MKVLLALLLKTGKSLLKVLITARMVLWVARLSASRSKNPYDDLIVAILEASYNDDLDALEANTKMLMVTVADAMQARLGDQ